MTQRWLGKKVLCYEFKSALGKKNGIIKGRRGKKIKDRRLGEKLKIVVSWGAH